MDLIGPTPRSRGSCGDGNSQLHITHKHTLSLFPTLESLVSSSYPNPWLARPQRLLWPEGISSRRISSHQPPGELIHISPQRGGGASCSHCPQIASQIVEESSQILHGDVLQTLMTHLNLGSKSARAMRLMSAL